MLIVYAILMIVLWYKYSDKFFGHFGLSKSHVMALILGSFFFDALRALGKVFQGNVSEGLFEFAFNLLFCWIILGYFHDTLEQENTSTDS